MFQNADEVFTQMKEMLKVKGNSLVPKVNGIIKFEIKNVGSWVLDLKNGNGSVTKDGSVSPNLTVVVSQEDFLLLAMKKLNPQQAFMKGKIKVKGNMGLAMKLNVVLDATRDAFLNKSKSSNDSSKKLKSDAVFTMIEEAIQENGKSFVEKTKGIYQFMITPGGEWHLDLKNGKGALSQGVKKADLTITVSDDDFFAMSQGKLNPQQAFMKGKLKVKGNMGLAMKLNTVLDAAKPKAKL